MTCVKIKECLLKYLLILMFVFVVPSEAQHLLLLDSIYNLLDLCLVLSKLEKKACIFLYTLTPSTPIGTLTFFVIKVQDMPL